MPTTKILTIAFAAICSVGVAYYISFEGSTGAIIERFPDIDPDVVRKVHKEIYLETLRGEYNDVNMTDEFCDQLFLTKAQKYLK